MEHRNYDRCIANDNCMNYTIDIPYLESEYNDNTRLDTLPCHLYELVVLWVSMQMEHFDISQKT
jgi:hypothetical protein|tara:strand:+ start:2431 stop:2622 length:192 start_codon:yes stop_codon:yes gene_type:complete